MYGNKKKHRLLKTLSNQYILATNDESDVVGLDFKEITEDMGLDKNELLATYIHLKSEDEVDRYTVAGIDGLYLTNKGYSSYCNKKYLLENEKIIFDRIKNWIQTGIPLLSLLVTIFVTYYNVKSNKESKRKIELMEQKINSLNKVKTDKK